MPLAACHHAEHASSADTSGPSQERSTLILLRPHTTPTSPASHPNTLSRERPTLTLLRRHPTPASPALPPPPSSPSHFSHSRPIAMPGCFMHMMRSVEGGREGREGGHLHEEVPLWDEEVTGECFRSFMPMARSVRVEGGREKGSTPHVMGLRHAHELRACGRKEGRGHPPMQSCAWSSRRGVCQVMLGGWLLQAHDRNTAQPLGKTVHTRRGRERLLHQHTASAWQLALTGVMLRHLGGNGRAGKAREVVEVAGGGAV